MYNSDSCHKFTTFEDVFVIFIFSFKNISGGVSAGKKATDYSVNTVEFGKRISLIRKEKGISVKEMSDFFGMYPQTIYKWERGTAFPDVDNLLALSSYLEVNIDYLLTGRLFFAA